MTEIWWAGGEEERPQQMPPKWRITWSRGWGRWMAQQCFPKWEKKRKEVTEWAGKLAETACIAIRQDTQTRTLFSHHSVRGGKPRRKFFKKTHSADDTHIRTHNQCVKCKLAKWTDHGRNLENRRAGRNTALLQRLRRDLTAFSPSFLGHQLQLSSTLVLWFLFFPNVRTMHLDTGNISNCAMVVAVEVGALINLSKFLGKSKLICSLSREIKKIGNLFRHSS